MTTTEVTTTPAGGTGRAGPSWATLDGNEAVARVAYALSEVVAIYPITPASPMGEAADTWSAGGRENLWGEVPTVVEMQSEGGAAGALHGAATGGSLATTFTASQGLLLMLPNLYKLAGELTPAVVHVAARAVATHALSIFGDHSDVMAVRPTGMAMLFAGSVQEAHDLAAVAHAASLASRVPFLHVMDGFRTSHELDRVALLADDDLRALIEDADVEAQRRRGLSPDRPVLRGTAQNPDVFFQAREAAAPFHAAVPDVVADALDRLATRTGRRYGLVDYTGAPDAERVVVLMGSGVGAATEAVEALTAAGERVGLLQVRLFRPFPTAALLAALPDTVRSVAVLDRTKEPGSQGEPLFQDVLGALAEQVGSGARAVLPRVVGGRYGLGSKELTPAMVAGVLDELDRPEPRPRLTVGIVDDVSGTSVAPRAGLDTDAAEVRALFYGLGSDGTVSANKAAVKIVGEQTDRWAQGYFVYDSKKSGAMTVSHLRFSTRPIRSTYLVQRAGFVACHHLPLLERVDVLAGAEDGATVLLNSPWPADELWDRLPLEVQEQVVERGLRLWAVDAHRVAAEVGMPGRLNAVLLPCFFALSGILPRDEAIAQIKRSFASTYGRRGRSVVERNEQAVDRALGALVEVPVPDAPTTTRRRAPVVPPDAPDLVQRVTARLLAGEGDQLPVSALPVDGTWPTGTARFEKRRLADQLPVWDPDLCIDCGRCALVCPHAAIRIKVLPDEVLQGAADVTSKPFRSRQHPDHRLAIAVAPDDCTGCGVCIDVCPARSREVARHKALDPAPAEDVADAQRTAWDAFLALPETDRTLLDHATSKGAAALEPLFEFSGACAGCGETPYLRLLTQLAGYRSVEANATGCSSIFGGHQPTTPWTTDAAGRGPAWSNSLFEDNAEFGLGIRLALDARAATAATLLRELAGELGDDRVAALLAAEQRADVDVDAQRARVAELREALAPLAAGGGDVAARARRLVEVADELVRRSVWIVGGDGWAYDIGFGGLDHVLASGLDVNVLVLDTEVYSNTGGQASKATPRAAVAKFATGGKRTPKKDLGMIAMAYGDVYVAQVAMGANDLQCVKAFTEAEAWPGPSLILAYSTCIAHGIDMGTSMTHQKALARSGYWPLYRYHPGVGEHEHPFHLDSHDPDQPLARVLADEGRYAMLGRTDPEAARRLGELGQADVDERWRLYRQLAGIERTVPHLGSDLSDVGEEPDADPSAPPSEEAP